MGTVNSTCARLWRQQHIEHMHIDLENEAFMTVFTVQHKAPARGATALSFHEVGRAVKPAGNRTPPHMTGWNIEAASDHFRAGCRSGTLWSLTTG